MVLGKLRNILCAITIINFDPTEKNPGCIHFEEVSKGVWTTGNMVWRHWFRVQTRFTTTDSLAISLQSMGGPEAIANAAGFWNWVGAAVNIISSQVNNEETMLLIGSFILQVYMLKGVAVIP